MSLLRTKACCAIRLASLKLNYKLTSRQIFIPILLIINLISIYSFAQTDCIVDFDKISQKQIKKLFQDEGLCQHQDFIKLRSLCYDELDSALYRKHFRTFLVEADLESVWNMYKTISPKDTWRGKMVTFGCQYSRYDHQLTYLDNDFNGLKPGQMLFMNLRLLGGLVNIAVSHEIMEVNETEHYIKICYLEKGAAQGTQWIRFYKDSNKITRIEHETRYRSDSKFRDKHLYPNLHGKAIAEFHQHIKEKIDRMK
ncbi:MAG: hypothetical protein IPJ74_22885 [Saprospiraceae bacterium]|nr:hypothetical protein [Saprospiraceae bacterium]